MTTVQTRAAQVAAVEHFEITIRRLDGTAVDLRANGVLGPYGWEKALRGDRTVANFRDGRFNPHYPGYTCDVLYEDGSVAAPQTHLNTVRESYEQD